jgi:hypothetical protein
VHEYNYLLGQLRKEPPKLEANLHRGWRMMPEPETQSGGEAKKLAAEATKAWDGMIKDYRGTPFAERAEQGRKTLVGLKWAPTGGTKTTVSLHLGAVRFDLDPLKVDQDVSDLKQPTGSGGLMAALYQYRRLLTLGAQGFEGRFEHGGHEPFYPPDSVGSQPKRPSELRVDCEVLRTEHAAVPAKWYFSRADQSLLGFEVTVEEDQDPCEVYLSDYRPVDGRMMPHRFEVHHGNNRFMIFTVKHYQMPTAK